MTATAIFSLYLQDLKKVFSYRANFWMQFVGAAGGEIVIAILLWTAIYSDTGQSRMGGLSLNEMIYYYVLSALFSRLVRGAESFDISHEIYDGSLTRYLIYPGHYFIYKLIDRLGYLSISLFQSAIGLSIFYIFFSSEVLHFSFTAFALGLTLVIASSLFYFFLMMLVELCAFWADNVWSLSVMMRFITGFFSGMILPLSLYPEWLQAALSYTPFPSLMYWPIQLFLGKAGWEQFFESLAILGLWLIFILFILNKTWRRGLKTYTGVGQ